MPTTLTVYEAGTSLDWDGDTKVSFLYLPIKTFFVGYSAILALGAMKRQTLLPSLPWICLIWRLMYPILIFKQHINQYIFCTWQSDWNGAVTNKLHSVKPVLGDWQSSYRECRKDEVLCRACISHTHLTHSYILSKDPPPQCEYCQCILTVWHNLVECNHFAEKKEGYIWFKRSVVESFHTHFIIFKRVSVL